MSRISSDAAAQGDATMIQNARDDNAAEQTSEHPRDTTAWIAAEREVAVRERRRLAGLPEDGEPWGLALSGGGIRSATFCLGLIRGLAKNKLLRRFDYLSTVSGGGYIGASLGRLFGNGASVEEIERGIESERSLWLWWLRSNGRYLTPTGVRDLGQAAVSIVRGAIATQLELGILLMLLATAIILPHVLVATIPWVGRNANSDDLPFSFWILILPLPFFMGGLRLFGYWLTRARPVNGGTAMLVSYALLYAALAAVALDWTNSAVQTIDDLQRQIAELPWSLRIPIGTLLAAAALAMVFAIRDARRIRADQGEFVLRDLRLRYTRGLLFWTITVIAVVAIALIDWISWQLATIADSGAGMQMVYGGAGLAALGLVLCRAVQPVLQNWMNKHPGHHINIERVLGIIVYGLLISIVIGWATLVHDMVLPAMLWRSIDGAESAFSLYPLVIWGMLFLFGALFLLLTGRNFETVNMASLHGYYRARIERAYVSSGNVSQQAEDGRRFDRHPSASIDGDAAEVRPPDTVVRGDDIVMSDYAPQAAGGPIHLINCCINQTVDDGSRYFNGDRKGVCLTVNSTGKVEIGIGAPQVPAADTGFLSKWIAISGAAAGSGMGSQTSPTYSALLFLSGIRLGMWLPCLARHHHGQLIRNPQPPRRGMLLRLPLKVQAIVSELLGQFPGLGNDTWYVSDGGHFENTGVYALIKRELSTIVIADCGADPQYLFEDMESMIRKVRIDFGAEIEFIEPKEIPQGTAPELSYYLGTPETIGPEPDNTCLLLGRIRYRNGTRGMLLVVKPRRLEHLPFDTIAYADRHPKYPQQSTGDQFFDEAQWESYQKLGYLIGQVLTPTLIAEARALIESEASAVSSLTAAQAAREKFTTRIDRLRPVVTASAAGAGIGLSLVLALWQGGGQAMDMWQSRIGKKAAEAKSIMQQIEAGKADGISAYAIVDLRGISAVERQGFVQVMSALDQCEAPQRLRCVALKTEVNQILMVNDRDYWNTFHVSRAKQASQTADAMTADAIEASAPAVSAPEAGTTSAPTSTAASGVIDAVSPPSASVDAMAGDDPSPVAVPETGTATLPIPVPPEPSPVVASSVEPTIPLRTDEAPPKARKAAAGVSTQVDAPTKSNTEHDQQIRRQTIARTVSKTCDGNAIYVHIYSEPTRRPAQCLLDVIEQRLGQRPQGVENVVVTAMRRGKTPSSKAWGVPAVLYGESNHAQLSTCAAGLKTLIGSDTVIRALPPKMRLRSNVVEIWLPADWRGDEWLASQCRSTAANAAASGG
jgi:hypothetical protein